MAHGQRECIDILLKGASPTSACGGRGDGNTVLHVTAMTRGGVPVLKKLMSSSTYKGGTGEPFDLSWLEWRNRYDTQTTSQVPRPLRIALLEEHWRRIQLAAHSTRNPFSPVPSSCVGEHPNKHLRFFSQGSVVGKAEHGLELKLARTSSPCVLSAMGQVVALRRSGFLAVNHPLHVPTGAQTRTTRGFDKCMIICIGMFLFSTGYL